MLHGNGNKDRNELLVVGDVNEILINEGRTGASYLLEVMRKRTVYSVMGIGESMVVVAGARKSCSIA